MEVLRISQTKLDGIDRFSAEMEYDGRIARTEFTFSLSEEERASIRWYLEDFLMHSQPPNDERARRIEALMQEKGAQLYRDMESNDQARMNIWPHCMSKLSDTRVEVQTSVEAASAIPWELLYIPHLESYLSLEAQSFVRSYREGVRRPDPNKEETVRVLLVICRPDKGKDVAFRSVASRIIKSLGTKIGERITLEVLRPATYVALAKKLHSAKLAGKPYHVVHFDGHGAYVKKTAVGDFRISNTMFADPDGKSGYLVFEDPKDERNREFVSGKDIGQLLAQTDVPVLVLNACKSAYAERDDDAELVAGDDSETRKGEVAAYGSLAQEVMQAGVNGVVAMRYSVYVVTAAQFVADLYATLAQGHTLGQAVNMGRKMLHKKPERQIGRKRLPLQDWMVPIVYESAPVRLFPEQSAETGLASLNINITDSIDSAQQPLDEKLPRTPILGFFGRDETLLALDRAFDSWHVALLHAYAGSGKTTTAAEFARWYSLTGGLGNGVVLFSSFENYHPLEQVLADFGRVFAPSLQHSGVHWQAITDKATRRQLALDVLRQVPVLWIWDNVEEVDGFPKGTPSAWSEEEQQELVDFLHDAQDTHAKFLLTSRMDERAWLGKHLPKRIEMPPMPLRERWQMAEEIVSREGGSFDYGVWRPLLLYSQGNPLTLQILVTQAMEEKLSTSEAVNDFVDRLRAGEVAITDDKSEGRSKSLGASLAYGFDQAFTEEERAQLALLHLFQGFVNVNALVIMGADGNDWCLDALRGKTGQDLVTLLDKAVDIGVLEKVGTSLYDIHPALPWFLRGEFEAQYPTPEAKERAQHAYVEAIGYWGNKYIEDYINGKREVIHLLAREEANLLHARRIVILNDWWDNMGTMQGIQTLYDLHGRRAEWRALVEEIVPDFCDLESETPLPGREIQHWSIVMHYRVRLARQERRWPEAERLQQIRTGEVRKVAQPWLNQPVEDLDGNARNTVRELAVSLEELGQIQREQGEADCIANYMEALGGYQKIGDRAAEAICSFNLGHAYKDIEAIRDMAEAETRYRCSLELRAEGDNWGRATCLGQLGLVAIERFMEVQDADEDASVEHLNEALDYYRQALDLLPSNAVNELAITHNQLGAIYQFAGQFPQAIDHYQQSIQYREQAGDHYGAATTRFNIGVLYANQEQFQNALLYAQAALQGFQRYPNTDQDQAKVLRSIDRIQKAMDQQ